MMAVGVHMVCCLRSQRKTAHLWGGTISGYVDSAVSRTLASRVQHATDRAAFRDQHTDPTLSRSASSLGRPDAQLPLSIGGKATVIEYHATVAIDLPVNRANSWPANTYSKGRKLCKRHLSFLPQWQCSASLAVSKVTLSAASLAQRAALWQQKFWAQIQRALRSQALPSACFATMQASTVVSNTNTRVISARLNQMNRRPGITPAAIFCLGEPTCLRKS